MHGDTVSVWDVGWFELRRCDALAGVSTFDTYATFNSKSTSVNKTTWFAWKGCRKVWRIKYQSGNNIFWLEIYEFLKKTSITSFRLLSMTPICCLEASSNSSQVLNSSNNTVQLNTSTAVYNRRDSSNNNVNPSQPNQVTKPCNPFFIF